MDPMSTAKLIMLGIEIAQAVAAGIDGAMAARDQVSAMVKEGREPTEAEWQTLNSIGDANRRRIQALADKAAQA